MPKFLPGTPSIIVRTMTGGSGIDAANFGYASKPDGLTLFVSSGSQHIPYLLGSSAARYDFKKVYPVMAVAQGNIYLIKPGIITKPEDLTTKGKSIIYGASGGGLAYIFGVGAEVLEMQIGKFVMGYSGSGDARRAFLSGEINTASESTTGYWDAMDSLVKKGEIQLLFQSGLTDEKGNLIREQAAPPTSTVAELYQTIYSKAPSGMVWDAYKMLVSTLRNFSIALSLPPGVSDDMAKAWWDAAGKTINDSGFKQESERLTGAGSTKGGKAFADDFKAKMVIDTKIVDYLKDVFAKKYGVTFQ